MDQGKLDKSGPNAWGCLWRRGVDRVGMLVSVGEE